MADNELRFIYRTDVHAAAQSPVSWKGDYPAEIWKNLEQIGELAEIYEADAVIDGGDFFHVKAPSRNSHHLITKTAQIHAKYPCPTYSVEGNHDIAYNNRSTIEKQPLGVLYETGVFRRLESELFERGGVKARIIGFPYDPNRTTKDIHAAKRECADEHVIAVIHALAAEAPRKGLDELFGEPVLRYADLISKDGPEAFLFGHWHKDQGIVTHEEKIFVNQGAVSRGALSGENLSRTPKVALIRVTEAGVTAVALPLNVAPAEDVFDIERKERLEKEAQSIDAFVSRLTDGGKLDPSEGIDQVLCRLDFARDVRDRAERYLAKARES
jgi:DNA repair exonuclease SbcCD nuclease subunit